MFSCCNYLCFVFSLSKIASPMLWLYLLLQSHVYSFCIRASSWCKEGRKHKAKLNPCHSFCTKCLCFTFLEQLFLENAAGRRARSRALSAMQVSLWCRGSRRLGLCVPLFPQPCRLYAGKFHWLGRSPSVGRGAVVMSSPKMLTFS